MSIQLYSHSKQDLEKVVEIILNKVQNFQLKQISKESKPEELISQKEASKFLKISLPTIIDWRNNKDLPHYDFNGRFYDCPKELREYGRKNNQK